MKITITNNEDNDNDNDNDYDHDHELLRIPAGGRLTSWLFTQRGRGVELGTTENKNKFR